MGTSDRNLHIYVPDQQQEAAVQQITAALPPILQTLGYSVVDAAEAQQTITVIADPGASWVSVYHDFRDIPNLPVALSQSVGMVVQLSVHDSDVVETLFCRNGQVIDRFCDWANFDQTPKQVIGDAALWKPLLPAGITPDRLRAAWQPDPADYPFASEGILYRVMDLLKLERWRFGGLESGFPLPDSVVVTPIHFRYAQKLPYDELAEGLPIFEDGSYLFNTKIAIGESFGVTISLINHGGSGRGMEIQVRGGGLYESPVEATGLITEPPFDHRTGKITAVPQSEPDSKDRIAYRFSLPDYIIRPGFADWKAIYKLQSKLRDFNHEFQTFTVVMKARTVGDAPVEIRVIPLENPYKITRFVIHVEVFQ